MERFSFTQCVSVLFEGAPALEDVQRALGEWRVVGEPNQGPGEHGWAVCGPGFIVELRGGAFAVVDVVDRAWPDDPREGETIPAIGSAWRAGAFGPASTPGALARAVDQPWAWPEGAAAAKRHGGFVRLRTGRASEEGEPPERSRAYDPVFELASLTELARPLLGLENALGSFVPGGEALRSRDQVSEALDRKVGVGPPPLELWSNLRSVALPAQGSVQWLLLDTSGMHQLGLPDQEAVFAQGQEEPEAVEAMLRNACLHLLSGPIAPGSTAATWARSWPRATWGRRWGRPSRA